MRTVADDDQQQSATLDFVLVWRWLTGALFGVATEENRKRLLAGAIEQLNGWPLPERVALIGRIMDGTLAKACFRDEFVAGLRREAVAKLDAVNGMPEDPGLDSDDQAL